MCGAKRLGHFGRNEFFIALKLISAAQNGLVPMLDICNSGGWWLYVFYRDKLSCVISVENIVVSQSEMYDHDW